MTNIIGSPICYSRAVSFFLFFRWCRPLAKWRRRNRFYFFSFSFSSENTGGEIVVTTDNGLSKDTIGSWQSRKSLHQQVAGGAQYDLKTHLSLWKISQFIILDLVSMGKLLEKEEGERKTEGMATVCSFTAGQLRFFLVAFEHRTGSPSEGGQ